MTQKLNTELSLNLDPKVTKKITRTMKEDLDLMNEQELKQVIAKANESMEQTQRELDENDEYQRAKEKVSAVNGGKRSSDQVFKAHIKYSLARIRALAALPPMDRFNYDRALMQAKADLEAKRQAKSIEDKEAEAQEQDEREADEELREAVEE